MLRIMQAWLLAAALGLGLYASAQAHPQGKPVLIGLDGEFSVSNSTSAQAIEQGIRVAMEEINRAGGVLNARPLQLVTLDNRSNPARGIANIRSFAAMPDLVAVFGGRFSPVVLETLKPAHETKLIVLAAWSSANDITNNGYAPNYAFRLSLYDDIAMPAMIERAKRAGARKLGLLLANTTWGRSNLMAAERHMAAAGGATLVATEWYNWGEPSFAEHYRRILDGGAECILLVANDREGALLVHEITSRPQRERLPVVAHWGITGGDFAAQAGMDKLLTTDFSVVQTFSFAKADPARASSVLGAAKELLGATPKESLQSPVGFAHAYDLTHILALAIQSAGTTDRAHVRTALESIGSYNGLVRHFDRPFSASRHEALQASDVFFGKYRADGSLVPVE